jgi:hypothetical protein
VPPKPYWFKKVRLIRASVEASPTPFVDRQAVQALFGLQARQAGKLLRRLPGHAVGNAYVASREGLLAFLRAVEQSGSFRTEETRRGRVREALEEARKDLAARAVRVAVPASAPTEIDGLPKTIHLAPGELRITFRDAQDLLQQLFLLSRAMGRDFPRFEAMVEAASGSGGKERTDRARS